MTADSAYVYYTVTDVLEPPTATNGQGSVFRVALADGARTKVAATIRPGVVLVDATHLYWVEGGSLVGNRFAGGSIKRVPLAGGAVETMTVAGEEPSALASDATYLYVGMMKGGVGLLTRIPKSGGPSETLYQLTFASAVPRGASPSAAPTSTSSLAAPLRSGPPRPPAARPR